MNDLTLAAVSYLAAGLHLLALTGKRPNTKFHGEGWDWDNSIHGLPESGEDEEALDQVFSDRSTTGVAILIPQHVLVADVDTEEAATLLHSLGAGYDFAATRVAKTPHGLHLWFLAPGANASVWVGGRTLLMKGFGGYCVAPPSTVDGQPYRWIGDWAIIDWLPDGVEKRLRVARAVGSLKPAKTVEDHSGEYIQITWIEGKKNPILWKRWNIAGLCRAIVEAPEGNQNSIIAWASMAARDEGVPFETAYPLLMAAAAEGNHPERRARDTIKGAYRRGKGVQSVPTDD